MVKTVLPRQRQLEVKHEEVPGFMPAMTMPFDVKDTNELAGLQPGQAVVFRLTVGDTEAWIDQIEKLGSPSTNSAAGVATTRIARDVELLAPGDPLPEYHLTNQFGRRISTADFQGQALAITFLFTRCPYPTYCPKMAAEFRAAQGALLASPSSPTNWHLLAISFDPEYDRPEVLKGYAEAHRYDPRHWSFATGALIDLTAIGEQFGLAFWRDPGGSLNHNLRTAIIDAGGRVQTVIEGNTWTGEELAAELDRAARKR